MPPFADAKKRSSSNRNTRFNPFQPRGGDGRWIPVGQRIAQAEALAGQGLSHQVSIAPVSRPGALSRLVGRDVRGFKHRISNEAISHAKRGHPDLGTADFQRIPQIVKGGQPELVKPAPNGSPRVRYRAEVDGVRYGYVAEIRGRKKRIDMVTLYRR